MAGSVINTIGIVFASNAIAKGPTGPASAIFSIGSFLFTILQSLKLQQVPGELEMAGLLFGTLGALMLVVPRLFETTIFRTCFKAKNSGRLKQNKELISDDFDS